MKVLIAGAAGAIGVPLVTRLLAAGDQVTGIARSTAAADALQQLGAAYVCADVLDREALSQALSGSHFDVVVHQLTALKKAPARYRDMAATNTLRTTGTANLLRVAQRVGATRFVTQSIVFGYGFCNHEDTVLTEAHSFGVPVQGPVAPTMAALRSTEMQVFDHPDVEGTALRYGLLYGGDIVQTSRMLRRRMLPVSSFEGRLAMIHHDDAAGATEAALRRGKPDTAYNVVDYTPVTWRQYANSVAIAVNAPRPIVLPGAALRAAAPYAGLFMTRVSMTVSNERARRDLQWVPTYASYRDGIAASAQRSFGIPRTTST